MALPDKDKEETILLVLDDLRRLFDHISNNYANLKNRVLGLIAGEVAITSFIFAGKGLHPSKFTSSEKIFFGVGVILLATCFGLLLWIIATAYWEIPLDIKMSRKLYTHFDSKLAYLEDIKEDHENCIEYSLGKMSIRSTVYNRVLLSSWYKN
jgi:hypothetical protein